MTTYEDENTHKQDPLQMANDSAPSPLSEENPTITPLTAALAWPWMDIEDTQPGYTIRARLLRKQQENVERYISQNYIPRTQVAAAIDENGKTSQLEHGTDYTSWKQGRNSLRAELRQALGLDVTS